MSIKKYKVICPNCGCHDIGFNQTYFPYALLLVWCTQCNYNSHTERDFIIDKTKDQINHEINKNIRKTMLILSVIQFKRFEEKE